MNQLFGLQHRGDRCELYFEINDLSPPISKT